MGAVFRWISDCITTIKEHGGNHGHENRSQNFGRMAEKQAAKYLKKQGLKLIERNFSTKAGEIDLIMRHDRCLVFIEVKYREKSDWAQAAETVTEQKQKRIIKAAKQYLQQQNLYDQVNCRFDVVAIDGSDNQSEISWIKHAFY